MGRGEGNEGGSKYRRYKGMEEGGKLVLGSRVGDREQVGREALRELGRSQ